MTKLYSNIEKKLSHYVGKAICDYKMIRSQDRVLVALSGGKDSFTMLNILRLLQQRSRTKFRLFVLIVDQNFPGWNADMVLAWLENKNIDHAIFKQDVYGILREKIQLGSSFYCPLCSRLRRGIIYRYAREHGFNVVSLGHHRDDLVVSLLMSIFYNGAIRSMPPKFLTDDKKLIVIRPLAFCQEEDIAKYATLAGFPIIPGNPCQFVENPTRKRIASLLADLKKENVKIPSNALRALQNVSLSQLMDQRLWDFKNLREEL